MLGNAKARWGAGLMAVVLISVGLFRPAAPPDDDFVEVWDAEREAIARELDSGGHDALTTLERRLAREHNARQVLLLQAIPREAPLVVAAPGDSSDDEPATHWPSPWEAVNDTLAEGGLDEAVSVTGTYGGFRYRHHLIPLGGERSRVLLVNRTAPAPRWTASRWLVVASGGLLLAALAASR